MGHIIPGGTGFGHHRKVKKFVDRELEEELIFDFEDDDNSGDGEETDEESESLKSL
ncbi:MAG: hypothetical protein H0W50_10965 [Parachlamydiaceae bacterium]|nr:hypothetical protein [Parachlamydiaceae bacterium]